MTQHRTAPLAAALALIAGALCSAGCPLALGRFPDGGGPGGPDQSPAHCANTVKDADETDVDCGGSCGATCVYGETGGGDRDCGVGHCVSGKCAPTGSTCADHVLDGMETDIDCGGDCPLCADGKHCTVNDDCASGQCSGGSGGTCATGAPPFSFAAARFANAGQGTGAIVVNGKPVDVFFARETGRMIVRQPLVITNNLDNLDIMVSVQGGGESGQAGAVRHGITRALMEYDISYKPELKKAGLVTRDAREVERKKVGLRKARRAKQFSKR